MDLKLVENDYQRWDAGETIGRYTLLARIAIGGMAEIWLARQMGIRGFERVVVIKRISDAYCADANFLGMFLDEARIAAQLDHPNIVQIHDLGEHRGAYYIAMEYLHGEDLAMLARTVVKTGERMPFTVAAHIVAHAAEGLASAHVKTGLDGKPLNVVHRDVSPQNIFITYEGVVKVLDFGVAKAAIRAQNTQGGQLKGKFGYMAPEQARGEEVDGRADVWSLGVVLWEAVTGARLLDPKQDPMVLIKELSSETPIDKARTRNDAVPVELEEIIDKALQRDPYKRWQSAADFKTALDKWVRAQPEAPSTVELSAYMKQTFAERMGRKSALIESARSGEIKFFKVPEALKPSNESSMPGNTIVTGDKAVVKDPPKRRRVPSPLVMAGVGLGAGVLVLAGAMIALLSKQPPVLDVDTVPGGARIEIDGVDMGPAPLHTTALTPGKHVVIASVEGRPNQGKTIVLVGGERLQLELRFQQSEERDVEQPAQPPQPVEEQRADDSPPERQQRPAPAVPKVGKLSIDTNPWTHVLLDGKKLGDTPLSMVVVPVGKHKLKLVNEEKKLSKTVDAVIQPGKVTTLKIDLTK